MPQSKRFNIRVYGILMNSKQEVLIADENRFGTFFTKFPGGGLEWGEGMVDCLKREFREELAIDIEVGKLVYCTDFFQQSAFQENDQLISVYYHVTFKDVDSLQFPYYSIPFEETVEQFRWVPINDLTEELFTFPIDKKVVKFITL